MKKILEYFFVNNQMYKVYTINCIYYILSKNIILALLLCLENIHLCNLMLISLSFSAN